MLFYRLECNHFKDKVNPHVNAGAYKCGVGNTALDHSLIRNKGNYPDPDMDTGISEIWATAVAEGTQNKLYCGFNSLDQYVSWFYDADGRKRAKPIGRLAVYEVDESHIHVGEYQSIFSVFYRKT